MPATPEMVTLVAGEKYVSLTTFTKDGRPKPTAVWIADLGDGTVGFTTSHEAWKAKRIRHTPRVTLQPCDMRGNVAADAPTWEGTADLDTSRFDEVWGRIQSKYGWFARLVRLQGQAMKLIGRGDRASNTAVVITLGSGDG